MKQRKMKDICIRCGVSLLGLSKPDINTIKECDCIKLIKEKEEEKSKN